MQRVLMSQRPRSWSRIGIMQIAATASNIAAILGCGGLIERLHAF
jgi:hypothetical protein